MRILILLALALTGIATATAQRPTLSDDLPLIDKPWSNDGEKFSFVILGDKTSGGEGKWPIYDRAVDAINLLKPDFVITVGDMIPGHMETRPQWDAEWGEYMAHAKRIEAPLFLTVGNHDIANLACYEFWREDFGRTYYSFDYKGCHFLIFNTEEERIDGRGPAWRAMMDWVKTDLAAASEARHTYVFFHKPMWDDPRFMGDWAELEGYLGARPFTVVAGHEHYHSTDIRDGNTYVIQSATGGGIQLSDARKWGGFHSFGFVTVDGAESRYAVVEPEGGIWPVDVAPASFRKAINSELVRADAKPGADFSSGSADVQVDFNLSNVLDKDIELRIVLEGFSETGWRVQNPESWNEEEAALVYAAKLDRGAQALIPLHLEVPRDRAAFPPNVGVHVRYDGAWIEKESMRMAEINTLPLHPVSSYKAAPALRIVGPFVLGPIDTSHLPEHPEKANAALARPWGPENGAAPGPFEGGLAWTQILPQGFGLINANALLGTLDGAAAYVACAVHSPEDQRTHAIIAADNFSQTYVNGALVASGQGFGAPGDFVYPELALKKGWNHVVVKLINNKADWFLRFVIADPMGNLILAADAPSGE
ncbi:MAG: metallophosphoesterase [Candidatus Hydrogenedentes bacterium]|nr:metallophosphoesterase [Candidatus Hydrogenedentota bacterium]